MIFFESLIFVVAMAEFFGKTVCINTLTEAIQAMIWGIVVFCFMIDLYRIMKFSDESDLDDQGLDAIVETKWKKGRKIRFGFFLLAILITCVL